MKSLWCTTTDFFFHLHFFFQWSQKVFLFKTSHQQCAQAKKIKQCFFIFYFEWHSCRCCGKNFFAGRGVEIPKKIIQTGNNWENIKWRKIYWHDWERLLKIKIIAMIWFFFFCNGFCFFFMWIFASPLPLIPPDAETHTRHFCDDFFFYLLFFRNEKK